MEIELKGLPKSAKAFTLVHSRLGKSIVIPSFPHLLAGKIDSIGSDLSCCGSMGAFYEQAGDLYRQVDKQDIPLYRRSISNLEMLSFKIGAGKLVMYGRDTEYLALAVRAHEFGRPKVIGRPIVLNISSDIAYGLIHDSQRVQLMVRLFEAYGIDQSFIHVDIGKYGNVPRNIIRALWPQFGEKQINDMVRLVDPQHLDRVRMKILGSGMSGSEMVKALKEVEKDPKFRPIEAIGQPTFWQRNIWGMGFDAIESRPHALEQTKNLAIDPSTGKVVIETNLSSKTEQLLAWVVRQAVVRAFLPKRRGLENFNMVLP